MFLVIDLIVPRKRLGLNCLDCYGSRLLGTVGGSEMSKDERPIAYHVNYKGLGKYGRPFEGSGFGVMFEDDGSTGYFYATTEKFDRIFDALHLYNHDGPGQPRTDDKIFIVWASQLQKAGIFYHDRFQAVIDFKNRIACCRTGFPPRFGEWSTPHTWDEKMIDGLEP